MSLEDEEVRQLLLASLDGDATEDQCARLNELLRTSEPRRRAAARFLMDDSLLREEIGTLGEALEFIRQSTSVAGPSRDDQRAAAGASAGLPSSPFQLASASTTPSGPRLAVRFRRATDYINRHGLMVAAALLLVAAGFAWHYVTMLDKFDRLYALAAAKDAPEVQKSKPASASPGAQPVARVTGASGCVWPEGTPPLEFGDPLVSGHRLKLERGVLQLTYDTGAKVTVEGPVDMVMTTAIEANISAGKIAAVVPRFARGYTIFTPTAEVVDLGTEFGVSVDESGDSEVHVFDGDVVTRSTSQGADAGQYSHARQDEALQFAADRQGPRRIAADPKKFIRRLIPDLPPEKLPPLPVTKNLALWLAADVMPEMKEGSPVSTWPDVLVGDNRFPDDAWQFDERLCPQWVRDGEGRPAIRFDGWSTFLATSPMETGDRQTAFVVFAPSPASFASTSHGGMLLKYGLDAPTLELTLMPDHIPRGLVWAAGDVGNPENVGILNGAPVRSVEPSALAYVYDAKANHAELIVNGVSQGTATAPRRIEQHAKKYIGSHAQPWYNAFYLGNIYEVIVFDAALDAADREQVFDYLSARYRIKLGP